MSYLPFAHVPTCPAQVRLPLSTEVDERLLFTCALAVLQYLSSCGEGAAVDEQGRWAEA